MNLPINLHDILTARTFLINKTPGTREGVLMVNEISPNSQIVIYQTEGGTIKLDVYLTQELTGGSQ